MSLELRPLTVEDLPRLRALVGDPSLAREFETLLPERALEDWWRDPYLDPGLRELALADGVPVGFLYGFVIPAGVGDAWGFLRVGVLASHRRRGIGSALFARALERTREIARSRGFGDVAMGAWLPNEAAAGFAARHGFRRDRTFWRMERPRGLAVPPPAWPAGVACRDVDGSDASIADWNTVYNRSFAEHYHFVPSSLETTRARVDTHEFRTGCVRVAYRAGVPAGFCRVALHGRRGEVAVLGTDPDARGIGLGRALLRWGVEWIERQDVDVTDLGVDGENENALRLYRSEGFAVTTTRAIWVRPAD